MKFEIFTFKHINIIFISPINQKNEDNIRNLINVVNTFDIDGCKIFYLYNTKGIYVHINLFNQYINLLKFFKLTFNQNNINLYIENLINDYNNGITIIYKMYVLRFVKYYFKKCYDKKDINIIQTLIREFYFLI